MIQIKLCAVEVIVCRLRRELVGHVFQQAEQFAVGYAFDVSAVIVELQTCKAGLSGGMDLVGKVLGPGSVSA